MDFGIRDATKDQMTEPARTHRKLYSITQKLVPDEIDDFKPKKKTVEMIKSA